MSKELLRIAENMEIQAFNVRIDIRTWRHGKPPIIESRHYHNLVVTTGVVFIALCGAGATTIYSPYTDNHQGINGFGVGNTDTTNLGTPAPTVLPTDVGLSNEIVAQYPTTPFRIPAFGTVDLSSGLWVTTAYVSESQMNAPLIGGLPPLITEAAIFGGTNATRSIQGRTQKGLNSLIAMINVNPGIPKINTVSLTATWTKIIVPKQG